MYETVNPTLATAKYVEAETVSEDSDMSSLSNFTDAASQINPFLEGIVKVKDLIQELEESFRESNNVGNNLILRCVLLRAENQNLVHKIDERNRYLSSKHWQFSVLRQDQPKLLHKELTQDENKRIACTNCSKTSIHPPLSNANEVDILYKTLEDQQKKLKERDKKIELLCQKYLHLKSSKSKMENDLKSKILSLEKQLETTYGTLTEFQDEVEVLTSKSLSRTRNTYEALFLQEKLRCSKLMYENVKLHHKIKRLEEGIRRKGVAPEDEDPGGCWQVVRCPVDKSTSEPLMRHF